MAAFRIRLVRLHTHKTRRAIVRRRFRPGDGTVPNDRGVEADTALGGIVTRKVVIDQQCYRLAEQARGRPLRHQKEVSVEAWTMRSESVLLQIFRRDQSIRLQLVSEHGEIDALECAISCRCVNEKGVALLLRPAWQIACAKITRKDLLACDFRESIGAPTQFAVRIERISDVFRRRARFNSMGVPPDQIDAKGNAGRNPALQKFSACDRHVLHPG